MKGPKDIVTMAKIDYRIDCTRSISVFFIIKIWPYKEYTHKCCLMKIDRIKASAWAIEHKVKIDITMASIT
jgi:hypothetical protein